MTREVSNCHPPSLRADNFAYNCPFLTFFLRKSCTFSLQTLTEFEAAKTGSGVRFLPLTAVKRASQSQPENINRPNSITELSTGKHATFAMHGISHTKSE